MIKVRLQFTQENTSYYARSVRAIKNAHGTNRRNKYGGQVLRAVQLKPHRANEASRCSFRRRSEPLRSADPLFERSLLSTTLSFSLPFRLAARASRRVEAGLPRVYRSFPFPQILATVGRLVGGARLGTSGGGFAARLLLDQLNEKLPFLTLRPLRIAPRPCRLLIASTKTRTFR